MWCDPRRWLATLRARRRGVLCAWLPVFVLSAASGPGCAAMRGGEPDVQASATSAHAAHHAAARHEHEHEHEGDAAAHDSEPATPEPRPCPHCPLGSATNVGHDVCAATESPDHGGFVAAKHASERLQLAIAPNWLLPAARAAPPLIANLPPPTPLVATVPRNLAYCVLLI